MRWLLSTLTFIMISNSMSAQIAENTCFVIGHRGAPAYGGENTLWGFQKALDLGADGFELDVLPTKEGRLIVGHDFDLKRLIGYEQIKTVLGSDQHYVTEFTQEQLRKLKVIYPEPGGEAYGYSSLDESYRMPLLEEALDLLIRNRKEKGRPDLKIYIEIKTKEGYMNTISLNKISLLVTKALQERDLLEDENIWLQSFDFEMMDVLAANPLLYNLPKCQLAFDGLGEIRKFRKDKKAKKFLKKQIVNRGLQMFHVWKVPSKYILEQKEVPFIDIAHEMGIPVHLYTFRDPRFNSDYKILSALGVKGFESKEEELGYFMEKGVDAVMSDDVVSALEVRDRLFSGKR